MVNLLNNMNKELVKQKLLEAGYSDTQALDATINRLCDLKGKPNELLVSWIYEGKTPIFEAIEGVDSSFLRDKLCMKEPAIIIAYAMLLNDAKENSDYFKHLAENKIGFYPNNN